LGKVTYDNLWEGIGLTYEAAKGGITESVYRVAPGAEVSNIRLRYNAPVELQKDGKLKITFSRGYMTETAPIAWQEINGRRIPVDVAFKLSDGEIGFSVGKYDKNRPLIIDPIYSWHAFYGSSGNDEGYGIAVYGGNVYIAGYSSNTWNGPGGEPPIHAHSGNKDIVILKLNSSGTYQWHTFYGSSMDDEGDGIAVDGSGYIYIAGTSLASWQGDGNTEPKHAHSGGANIFVLKLNGSGAYQWHTFYGGLGADYGTGIDIDSSNYLYVVGHSSATWSGDGGVGPINVFTGGRDIVVLKLNSSGSYIWHTFHGGPGEDYGYGIAVDSSNNVYVTGQSNVNWNSSPIHSFSGNIDIVILKLSSGGAYQWHTFYGGSGDDHGYGIAVYDSGNVYVTGSSLATWQGDGGTEPLHAYSGSSYDIVVLKLNGSGTYQWHTFYGGSGDDIGNAIAVDDSGYVYATGSAQYTWNGPENSEPLHPHSGYLDIFFLKLDAGGAYRWHTFYGSSAGDSGNAISVSNGNTFIAGVSYAAWSGDGGASPLNGYSGNKDICVLKMSLTNDLTAKSNGTGAGSMTSTPAGISYKYPAAKIGAASFPEGSSVILTAKASAGSLVSWQGTCKAAGGTESGNNTLTAKCSIKLIKTAAVNARFTYQYPKLTVNAKGIGSGSVTSKPSGISYNYQARKTDSANFHLGTTVVVTATANTTAVASWQGTCKAAGGVETGDRTKTAKCSIKMTKPVTITAYFLKAYKITIDSAGSGSGSVTSKPFGISYKYPAKKTDSARFILGSTVIFTAAANSASAASWRKTCKAAGGTETGNGTRKAICAIKVTKPTAITARFRKL